MPEDLILRGLVVSNASLMNADYFGPSMVVKVIPDTNSVTGHSLLTKDSLGEEMEYPIDSAEIVNDCFNISIETEDGIIDLLLRPVRIQEVDAFEYMHTVLRHFPQINYEVEEF